MKDQEKKILKISQKKEDGETKTVEAGCPGVKLQKRKLPVWMWPVEMYLKKEGRKVLNKATKIYYQYGPYYRK